MDDLGVFNEELHYCLAADLCKGKDDKGEYCHDDHALCKAFLDALVIPGSEVLAGMCGQCHAEGPVGLLNDLLDPSHCRKCCDGHGAEAVDVTLQGDAGYCDKRHLESEH